MKLTRLGPEGRNAADMLARSNAGQVLLADHADGSGALRKTLVARGA